MEEEAYLLQTAKKMCPRLQFDQIDVLVVDEIGKDISGSGMDTSVVGRHPLPNSFDPQVGRIVVLDITTISAGNGSGLGMADYMTQRAFEKFQFEMT